MEIWLNPACSKCRTAQAALDEAGLPYTVRRYLDDPPTVADLIAVLDRAGLQPWDITRLGEPIAAELGLGALPRDPAGREQWIAILAAHPTLIQRPIITTDDGTTVVARDARELDRVLKAARG